MAKTKKRKRCLTLRLTAEIEAGIYPPNVVPIRPREPTPEVTLELLDTLKRACSLCARCGPVVATAMTSPH